MALCVFLSSVEGYVGVELGEQIDLLHSEGCSQLNITDVRFKLPKKYSVRCLIRKLLSFLLFSRRCKMPFICMVVRRCQFLIGTGCQWPHHKPVQTILI